MTNSFAFIRGVKSGRARFILLCTCFSIISSGCAYFNTYYNAETAYKNARREHEKHLIEREDTTVDIPAEVTSKYERAITKSQKLLEVYSRSEKWHDDALFLMGRAEYYKGEPISAVRRFKQLQKEFPESEFVQQAFLFMGKAYLAAGDLLRAEDAFQKILLTYPQLNEKEEITLLLAQVAIKREGKAQAIRLLEKTLKTVKTPEKKMEISLQIASLYMDLRQYEKATAVLRKAPRKKEYPNFLYRIDYNLLICYIESQKYDKAGMLAEEMIRNKGYLSHYPHIALQKGIVLARVEKVEDAIVLFEEIVSGDGPNLVRGKAHMELGALHQFRSHDLDKAREHYQSAMSLLGDDELRELAESRRDAIDELKRLRQQFENAQSDTVDTSNVYTSLGYRIGEVFWLRLEEPDSALHYFTLLEQNAGDDSLSMAKAMYARGWIWLHIKQDTVTADSILNRVIESFPRTVFAQKSQLQLGKDVTVMTRADSAQAAFLKAERLYFEDGDAVASANEYVRVATTYEDLPIAATSMYAAAWLCDNVLHKNVTAQTLYKRLCDTYPEHELCVSEIRPRLAAVEDTLRSLGQTPSTAAKKKATSSKKSSGIDEQQEFDHLDWEADEEPPPLPSLPTRRKNVSDDSAGKPASGRSKSSSTDTSH